ncbi:YbgC/FadM family acyl-CoA thioesterase [Stakelama pacifica]|uniref:Acyl-CoA thioester hydrolase n=1 Tax=Stakelama pacifica TaxID=517720 RepID=A0A4R6FEV5_9SPHN|nr:YbgC/FadM family acyl-CoA thioesterase [Stakelama pacifica]MAW99353.1 thioesterase [Sphingomonas sp.]TDN79240.1 acyl-CoA thioester hydrolase [Stakelama pacifica]GGO98639.1 tol-pal system-associated acyl-CoA thioesterase [Stakelama pacifica]
MTVSDQDIPVGGRFAAREHRFPVRVYFEDTDLSGIVYHANYLRYMERARSDMLRLLDIDQRTAFESGEGAYAVRGIDLAYLSPARLDDALLVVSHLTKVRAAAVDIHHTVMRGEDILARAGVQVAFVAPSGRPRRQPASWLAAFEPMIWKGN